MEAAENRDREMEASREREGSLNSPLSGICLPSCLSNICLESEEREVTILALELEAASEEEVKVNDRHISSGHADG